MKPPFISRLLKQRIKQIAVMLTCTSLLSFGETKVGSLPGDVVVDNTGKATYSIPLTVPPGTGGMEPKLSLVYSSSGSNGYLGSGWSLNAGSAITRTNSTLFHDGAVRGVDFTDTDRFMLDGQRLIVVSGNYGQPGSEYRTEVESFSKIVVSGSGGAIESFTVFTKSGLVKEYGGTSDSRVTPQGVTDALAWNVSKITDTAGNFMTFHYYQDLTNGEHRLTQIQYTGNTMSTPVLTPYNTVDLIYENREDVQVNYTAGGYVLGKALTISKRLSKIIVKSEGQYVRDYRLSYQYSVVSGNSQLISTQMFTGISGSVEGIHSLPASTFQWRDGIATIDYGFDKYSGSYELENNSQIKVNGDFNGDGKTDLLSFNVDTSKNIINANSGTYLYVANGDNNFSKIQVNLDVAWS